MSLGKNVSRLRGERELSQDDLAAALGVSRQSVSKWETDGSVPELDKLVKLSQLFGVSLDELVLDRPAPPEPTPTASPIPTTDPVPTMKSAPGTEPTPTTEPVPAIGPAPTAESVSAAAAAPNTESATTAVSAPADEPAPAARMRCIRIKSWRAFSCFSWAGSRFSCSPCWAGDSAVLWPG